MNQVLESNLIEFCRRLRIEGVRINQANTLVAIEALHQINLLEEEQFYFALRSVLCFSREDYRKYDRVYRGFWERPSEHAGQENRIESDEQQKANFSDKPDLLEIEKPKPNVNPSNFDDVGEELDENMQRMLNKNIDVHRLAAYSASEQLQHNLLSFRGNQNEWDDQLNWNALLKLIMQAFVDDPLKSGRQAIDLKRTVRANLQFGGNEWLKLMRRGKSRQGKQQLVTFADISGSMEREFITYLPLLYTMHQFARSSQLYLFTTNVFKVDQRFLQSMDKMVEVLNKQLKTAARGTNLGKSIAQFRKHYGHQLSPYMTTFFLFTDGWDRGDMELLKEQIALLSKQVYQIIWLNPMLGREGYTPTTQAIETIKPYMAHMVSAQDFTSFNQ